MEALTRARAGRRSSSRSASSSRGSPSRRGRGWPPASSQPRAGA